jgi:hypothetical protein
MASRKEQKERARAERERREAEAAKAARAKRMRAQVVAGVVVVAAAAGAAIAIASSGGGSSSGDKAPGVPLPVAAREAGCTLITHPSEGHNHTVGPVKYQTNPPSSGNHYPVPASDGIYNQAPDITHLVHALEHGRTILWYKPGAPASVVDGMKTVFNRDPRLQILTPNNTNMPYQVAASNWTGNRNVANPPPEFGHVIGCPTWNSKVPVALEAFIAQYKGKGPERQFVGPE